MRLSEELNDLPIGRGELAEEEGAEVIAELKQLYDEVRRELPDYPPYIIAQSVGRALGLTVKEFPGLKNDEPIAMMRVTKSHAIFTNRRGLKNIIDI
jgi:hypothetical protein